MIQDAQGWTQRDGTGREVGEGFRMGILTFLPPSLWSSFSELSEVLFPGLWSSFCAK